MDLEVKISDPQHRTLEQYHAFFERVSQYGLNSATLERPNNKAPSRLISPIFSPIYQDIGRPTQFVVLDEAQYVKKLGPTHAAVKAINCEAVIMLSGTFLANKWSDCFGVIDFLHGHPVSSLNEFLRIFRSKQGIRVIDPIKTQ